MKHPLVRPVPLLALCLPLFAFAQQTRPDPTHPTATTTPMRYQSAFADYKPWQPLTPGDWKKLNDDVAPAVGGNAQAGGAHAGHRQQMAAQPATQGLTPAAKPQADHQMHGGTK